MADRLKGYVVTLTTDIREDDAQSITDAILMIKGVLSVDPVKADGSDWMVRRRLADDMERSLLKAIRDIAKGGQ